jgi:hypothetical protein
LNENGLIVFSKVADEGLYLVIIGGENDPVDLMNLLRIVKEARKKIGVESDTPFKAVE